jgi:hypothetical protein
VFVIILFLYTAFIFILMGNVVIIEDRNQHVSNQHYFYRSLRSFTIDMTQTGPISDSHIFRIERLA